MCCFHFRLFKYFLISLVISFLTYWLFKSMLFNSINLDIFQHSCHYWFLSFKTSWALICDLTWSILKKNAPCAFEKNVCILLLSRVFCICLLYLVDLCVVQLVSLLIFCLVVLYLLFRVRYWHLQLLLRTVYLSLQFFNFGFRYFNLLLGVNLYNYSSFCCV